ncbi:type I-A CRISPR-associated protein Cas5a [Pyrococcus kukulkanii]|uniref:type I-A CRISPR-associated protein Cas5a n=1 Tax=Pyrococcus kukulkanii TaxID=1609559 RepID=UPI003564F9BE
MTFFLKVIIRPTGIVALRALPQSKMRTALRYIPPTTLIGAIAYPLLHLKGSRTETFYNKRNFRSAAENVLRLFNWVTVKIEGKPRLYGSLLKINTIYRGKAQSAVTSFPFAVMYGEADYSITAIYLINEEELSKGPYTLRDIERAAWGMVRIGSRESVISVESVKKGKTEIEEMQETRTAYAFQFKDVEVEGKGTLQSVVDWRSGIGDYSKAKHIIMFYPEGIVTVRGNLKVAKCGEEVIILAS